jgi:hypothetical protein
VGFDTPDAKVQRRFIAEADAAFTGNPTNVIEPESSRSSLTKDEERNLWICNCPASERW